jgi:hypothetical protein
MPCGMPVDTLSMAVNDLRQFVIDRVERIDFRRVDKFALVRLLTQTK